MEQFHFSPGLCHIVKSISKNLDRKNLAQCRLVCQSWMNLIDNDRPWLIFQLEHIRKKKRKFHAWKRIVTPLHAACRHGQLDVVKLGTFGVFY